MSTKIYDGFKINGVHSMAQLGAWVEKARSTFAAVHDEKINFCIQMMAANLYTKAYLANSLEEMPETVRDYIGRGDDRLERFRFIRFAQECMNGGVRHYHEITQASVQLMFTKDGQLLGIPFFNYKEATKWLKDTDGYELYGYWDNSDPQEDVSEEDWLLREKHWDEVIGYEPVSCYGLSLNLGGKVQAIDVAGALDGLESYWAMYKNHHVHDQLKFTMGQDYVDERFEQVIAQIPPLTVEVIDDEEFFKVHGLIPKAGK